MQEEMLDAGNDQTSSPQQSMGPKKDFLLQDYVRLAELGIEQGVTLIVGGAIITGTVISAENFYLAMANNMSGVKAAGDTAEGSIVKTIEDNYRFYATQARKPDDAPEDYVAPPRSYIHLKEAAAITGTARIPSSGGMLWRGKIESIEGFFPGTITTRHV